ncbi:MAG: Cell division protein FtsA [Chloroflexi bacterium]|jgi:cell division protein FtsA|nr:Cell division protein FtsA [Chloroflexota bacterium]
MPGAGRWVYSAANVSRARRVAALDLGTTKVCCAVAEVAPDGLIVQGTGEAPSRGMRKGSVIDIERAAEAVAEAVDAAERMAGVEVSQVIVGLAGGHIASQASRGLVAVGADAKRSREVRAQDVTRAVEAARAVGVPSDREIVHLLPRHFTVDGQDGLRDALGMTGMRLEVEALIVTGATTAIQNVVKVVHEAGLDCEDLVLQALASAEAVLSEEELERGVVVADVGGGTIDIAVFCGGSIAHTAVIPVGGSHVTGDLAVGLRSDLETAEMIKRQYGHCLQLTLTADATVTMTPMGYEEAVQVPQRYLAEVIGPRAREMAALILAEVERATSPASLAGGIVLTGGGALLRGFSEIAQQVTDMPVRVASPTGTAGMDENLRGAHHATVVGLLRWGARARVRNGLRSNGHGHSAGDDGFSERFGRWLRELF